MNEVNLENVNQTIEIEGLTKRYDGFTLDHISFSVQRGTIMGFIGQNGAGKSTTIKALLNVIDKDEGSIKLLGLDYLEHERFIKENIAVIFDEMPFHEVFTAKQLNILMKGLYQKWDEDIYFSYLNRFQLPVKKKIGRFSKGMKMKLQIATALSHHAKLIIMDEATTGLDPVVRNEILDIFREYMKDGENSILMSSHIISDLDKIADSVTFIDKGKLLLSGFKDEILDNHGIIKCSKEDYESLDKNHIISARIGEYATEVLVNDKQAYQMYPNLLIEKTDLEDIMLFYVNREKKEWS